MTNFEKTFYGMNAVGITAAVAVLAEDFITHKEQLASMDK